MKKIFLIAFSAGFVSTGFAQSSVVDVSPNKIRPAYETAPSVKYQASAIGQKVVVPAPVLNEVGLNAHTQPILQPAPVITKQQTPIDQKPVDKSSSVKEIPAVKKDN